MRRVAAAVMALAVAPSVPAASLVLNGVSYHTRDNGRYNAYNVGAGVMTDTIHVGAYRNSYYRWSTYAAYRVHIADPLTLEVGAATGYEEADLLPLAVPVLQLGPLRMLAIPPGCTECPAAIGAQWEIKL